MCSQNELKARWEEEKARLEKSKCDAEKKYDEINEQVFTNVFGECFLCILVQKNFLFLLPNILCMEKEKKKDKLEY